MPAFPKIILALFIAIPFIEIFLLLQIGGLIGVIPTILLVVMTAVLGANLLRQQGLATWARLQSNLAQGIMPTNELVDGVFILMGGVLLLTPGFFTDALGVACLVPAIRQKITRYAIAHFMVMQGQAHSGKSRPADVLEGEYRQED